ncbi:MAG: hypothetical protein KGI67_01350 [Pseudomonadota bacterium]|nr:hypothetical protein [Pseudomonadota bacterium]
MKAVVSKSLATLLKKPGGREAVRRAVLKAVTHGDREPVTVTGDVEGRSREITLRIVPIRG